MKLIKNGTSVPSSDQLKAQVKRLRVAMAEKQTPITQSMALEAVARQWGYRDWNTLSAATKSDDLRGWSVGQQHEVMILRACYTFFPGFSGVGLGLELAKNSDGKAMMASISTFVQEPQ